MIILYKKSYHHDMHKVLESYTFPKPTKKKLNSNFLNAKLFSPKTYLFHPFSYEVIQPFGETHKIQTASITTLPLKATSEDDRPLDRFRKHFKLSIKLCSQTVLVQ